jgi:hypothetical protein
MLSPELAPELGIENETRVLLIPKPRGKTMRLPRSYQPRTLDEVS